MPMWRPVRAVGIDLGMLDRGHTKICAEEEEHVDDLNDLLGD